VLLARTSLGAAFAVSTEYGLEIRALACQALRKAAPSSAREAYERAVAHVRKVAGTIRDPRFASLFLRRPVVTRILAEAEAVGVDATVVPAAEGGGDPLSRPASGGFPRSSLAPTSLGRASALPPSRGGSA
jgi:hypothetical protein